jgi:hypothetical protein
MRNKFTDYLQTITGVSDVEVYYFFWTAAYRNWCRIVKEIPYEMTDIESISSPVAVLIEIRRGDPCVSVIISLFYECESVWRFVKVALCRIRKKKNSTGNLFGIFDLILNHRNYASDCEWRLCKTCITCLIFFKLVWGGGGWNRNKYQESLKINIPGGKVRPARRADSLTTIY